MKKDTKSRYQYFFLWIVTTVLIFIAQCIGTILAHRALSKDPLDQRTVDDYELKTNKDRDDVKRMVLVFGILTIILTIIINVLLAKLLKVFWLEGKNGVGQGQNPGMQMHQIPQASQMTITDMSQDPNMVGRSA